MSNFGPDTGGRRWTLIRFASSLALRGGTGAAFPSALLRLPAALYGVCPALRAFQPSGVPQNRGIGCACAPCLPRRSGSGSQELDGRTPPGAARLLPSTVPASLSTRTGRVHAPSPLRVPSPSPRPLPSVPAPCVSP